MRIRNLFETAARLRSLALLLWLIPALLASSISAGSTRAQLRASSVLGSEVVAALAEQKRVRVMVAFSLPGFDRASLRHQHAWEQMWDENESTCSEILNGLSERQFQLTHSFRSVGAFAGWIDAEGVRALLRDSRVQRIDLATGGHGALAEVVPLVGLDTLQSMGFGGEGVTVALLDTGADLDHPDLSDSIVGEQCFCTSCCPDGMSTQQGAGSAEDDNGHGTSVAGIVTSNGGLAPVGGAPDADILLVKVLDLNNSFSDAADVIAGLDWIIAQRPDVDIVNMSLGTSMLFAGDCDNAPEAFAMAFATAIDTLRSLGVLTFAATQNDSSGTMMAAPACVANAVSVAASSDTDQALAQSNSNAQTDLFAPGANVLSTGVAAGTIVLTGTSQATAIATACAAALLEPFPNATPDQIEQAMKSSLTRITDPKNGLDFPRLDCAKAAEALPEADASMLACAALLALCGLRQRRASDRSAEGSALRSQSNAPSDAHR